jgi:hypothetical protein
MDVSLDQHASGIIGERPGAQNVHAYPVNLSLARRPITRRFGRDSSRARLLLVVAVRACRRLGAKESAMEQRPYPNETPAYRKSRNELLEAENALREQVEEVAKLRRALPVGGVVKEDYVFDELDAGGRVKQVKLSELFSKPHSNKKIKIETGFLNEDYNATIQELLQSEKVWMNGNPINVVSNSLEFKTRLIDKLISYSIDFEYAYDEINNV